MLTTVMRCEWLLLRSDPGWWTAIALLLACVGYALANGQGRLDEPREASPKRSSDETQASCRPDQAAWPDRTQRGQAAGRSLPRPLATRFTWGGARPPRWPIYPMHRFGDHGVGTIGPLPAGVQGLGRQQGQLLVRR